MTITKEQFIEYVEKSTALDVSDLVKTLEERFGVKAAQPQVVQQQEEVKETQTAFTVILDKIGDKKINVIKTIRSITGLGLRESKELADNIPKPIKENLSKDEAEKIKSQLEGEGATVVLQ